MAAPAAPVSAYVANERQHQVAVQWNRKETRPLRDARRRLKDEEVPRRRREEEKEQLGLNEEERLERQEARRWQEAANQRRW
jgi:hypothetical protein